MPPSADVAGLVLRNEPFSPRALAEAVGAGACCARRQQEHQGRDHDRARSAGAGVGRRVATARGAGKSRRQRGEIHREGRGHLHCGCRTGRARPRAADLHICRQRHRHERRRIEAAVPSVRAGERRDRAALRRRRSRPFVRQAHRQGDGRRSRRSPARRATGSTFRLTALVERVRAHRRAVRMERARTAPRGHCRSSAPRTILTAAS